MHQEFTGKVFVTRHHMTAADALETDPLAVRVEGSRGEIKVPESEAEFQYTSAVAAGPVVIQGGGALTIDVQEALGRRAVQSYFKSLALFLVKHGEHKVVLAIASSPY